MEEKILKEIRFIYKNIGEFNFNKYEDNPDFKDIETTKHYYYWLGYLASLSTLKYSIEKNEYFIDKEVE